MKKIPVLPLLLATRPAFAQPFQEWADLEILQDTSIYWPMLILTLMCAASVLAFALHMGRKSPPPFKNAAQLAAAHPEYTRLGGWLVIPMILMFFKAAGGMLFFVGLGIGLFQKSFWILIDQLGAEAGGFLTPSVLIGVVIMCIWPAFFLPVLIVRFFQRKTIVPAMIIVYTLTALILNFGVNALMIGTLSEESAYTLGYFLGQFAVICAIKIPWLLYFIRSKRVHVFFSC
jgi:hypothetical protein